jgi:hypothetical protein
LVACILGKFGKKSRVIMCDNASVYVSSYKSQSLIRPAAK